MDKRLVIFVLLLSFSSCIIGVTGGKTVKYKTGKDMYFENFPDEFKNLIISLDEGLEEGGLDTTFFVVNDEGKIIDTLPVLVVVRNYHPLGGLTNQNNKTILKAGHHFKYKGRKFVMRCGNLLSLEFIHDDKFYFTNQFNMKYKLESNYPIKFRVLDLSKWVK